MRVLHAPLVLGWEDVFFCLSNVWKKNKKERISVSCVDEWITVVHEYWLPYSFFCSLFFSFYFFYELYGNGWKILEMSIHSIIRYFLLYFPSSLLMVEHKSIMKCLCVIHDSCLNLPWFNCKYTTHEIIKLCWNWRFWLEDSDLLRCDLFKKKVTN